MTTRPLDLAARLRPEPRSFDWLFFVNGGLLVLFFTLFGSPFVLAPGFGISDLPTVAGANANARPPTHVITVVGAGQVIAGDGLRDIPHLGGWLKDQARTAENPTLLVIMRSDVSLADLGAITSVAKAAGFQVLVAAQEATTSPGAKASSP